MKRIIAMMMTFVLWFSLLPMEAMGASPGNLSLTEVRGFTDTNPTGVKIEKGAKNIDYQTLQLDFSYEGDVSLVTGKNLSGIKVYAGAEEETYKFDISIGANVLRLKLKTGQDNKPYYRLQKHKLYKIVIPQGILQNHDKTKLNQEYNLAFVTNTDTGIYQDDILVKTLPENGLTAVDFKNGTITFEFVDAITANTTIGNYIEITTSPVSAAILGYGADSLSNYNIRTEGNKLILTAKDGKFKDFALYTVKLKEQAIYLSGSNDNSGKVYNKAIDMNFTTDLMVESTNPVNGGENIGVEPILLFNFKYPVNYDVNKIKLIEPITNLEIPIDVSSSEKSISIAVREDVGDQPLKKNTAYRVIILSGGLSLKDVPAVQNTRNIDLNFTTGKQGDHPMASAYGSSEGFGDDIRDIDKTKLGESGFVYIKMNRPVQWDKDWSGDGNKEARNAKVTLYKMPLSQNKGYSQKGQAYDKDYEYIRDGLNGTMKLKSLGNYKERIFIEEFEIVGTNKDILKIKPKTPFLSLNQYHLMVDKEMLEDTYGHNLAEVIDFKFWTKGNGSTSVPGWNTPQIGGATTEEMSGLAHKKFRIHGTVKFSPTEPISLTLPMEVIPAAKEAKEEGSLYIHKALERILLRSTYYEEKQQLIGSNLEDTPTVQLETDTTAQLLLTSSANPAGETLKWISEQPNIATVDSLGKVKAVAKGQTQILTLDKNGNLLGKAIIKVEETLHMTELKLEYDEITNGKSTKILLYPSRELDPGRSYKLFIPGNVLHTRGNIFAPALELELVTGRDNGTAYVETMENSTVTVGDLLSKSEITFWIKGTNFGQDMDSVDLISQDKTISIPKEYIQSLGADQLKITLKDPFKTTLASEANVGDYTAVVHFEDGRSTTWQSNQKLRILTMGSPVVVGKYPNDNGIYDEKSFVHPVQDSLTGGKYFMRLTFQDADGKLNFNGETGLNNILDSILMIAGSDSSSIDKDFIIQLKNMGDYEKEKAIQKYILLKDTVKREANLYIPIKALRAQTTYHVTIRSGIVRNTIGENGEVRYSFTTRSIPQATKIEVGSVVENYDISEPILLRGELLEGNAIQVYFSGTPAYQVTMETGLGSGGKEEKYWKVYLPRGSSRLKAGVYDITISNGPNHQSVLYGSFSVVPAGKTAPNEGEQTKNTVREGEVKGSTKVSEDTLMIDSRFANDAYLSFNLDELMGEEVWVRKISYEGDYRDKINVLETKSKWANITLYGLGLSSGTIEGRITVSLGRVEPATAQGIQKKLKGAAKSDFIQVTGQNFKVQNIALSIPIKNSKGKNLKVYRYDEETRTLYEIKAAVNLVDQRVDVMSSSPGIFVVVE